MISAAAKVDVKEQKIKELVATSCKLLYKYILSKFEICIFYLILLSILSSLRLSVENGAGFNKKILTGV